MSAAQLDIIALFVIALAAMYAGCWLLDVIADAGDRRAQTRRRRAAAAPRRIVPDDVERHAEQQRRDLEHLVEHGPTP